MRRMKQNEIETLVREFGWATLCMVDPDGHPYGIEFSYFLNGEDICGLVHSRGLCAKSIKKNPFVCVKICESDKACKKFRAASLFGVAAFEFLQEEKDIIWAWEQLEKQLGKENDYNDIKEKYVAKKLKLPLLKITVYEKTGVTNHFLEELA